MTAPEPFSYLYTSLRQLSDSRQAV